MTNTMTMSRPETIINMNKLWEESRTIANFEEVPPEITAGALDLLKLCIEKGIPARFDNCVRVLRNLAAISIDYSSVPGIEICKMAIEDRKETDCNPLNALMAENMIAYVEKRLGKAYLRAIVKEANQTKDPVMKKAKIKKLMLGMVNRMNYLKERDKVNV